MITYYGYPKCGTCRKAKKWLEENGVEFKEVHIVEQPPTKAEIENYFGKSGLELKKFFNTCGQKYRELGLKDKLKTMSEQELIDLLSTDGMLLKRPIVSDGERVTVGFKEEVFEKNWK